MFAKRLDSSISPFEIQSLNDHGLSALRGLSDSVAEIVDIVERGDEDAFVELMEAGRRYFESRA